MTKTAGLIDQAVLGMFLPVVLFSGAACWLFLTRLLLPALRKGDFNLEVYAVGLSAFFSMSSHFTENVFYFMVRVGLLPNAVDFAMPIVGFMKLLILFGALLAVAVYSKALFGRAQLTQLAESALGFWMLGAVLAGLWLAW